MTVVAGELILTPRTRAATSKKIDGIYYFGCQYKFCGKEFRVEFEREYPLSGRLIDAVIDNFQIKVHGEIVIPGAERRKGGAA